MKNRFKNALREILNWIMRDELECTKDSYSGSKYANAPSIGGPSLSHNCNIDQFNDGVNFTMFNAVGGKIIRVHRYDPKMDRHHADLYIIMDNEDFGEEIAQIITRNSLSR